MSETSPPLVYDAIIIGAGFSGLCLAIRLQETGSTNFVVMEKSDGVGGVWRHNTYPGAACDIPSVLYSFSFERNPEWTRKYPPQEEIRTYLEDCVVRHGLEECLRFGTEVTSASYDESEGTWKVETADGSQFRARVVVSGVGQLDRPFLPEVPGLDSFSGPVFHSARWDHEFDARGRRIAVIGNGASAVQFVPVLAGEAGSLRVFQRSPNWIMRKRDRVFSAAYWDRRRRFPILRRAERFLTYWLLEARFPVFARGGPLSRLFERYLRRHMGRRVAPSQREVLIPDYPAGCKRILLSGDYLKALERENVSLEADGVVRIEGNRLVGGSGDSFEADAIIFATGFQTTAFLASLRVEGRDGRVLSEVWEEGAHAHLGIAVAGFPNFFLLYGPNTNLGHNSVIVMIESQVRFILEAIGRLTGSSPAKAIEVRSDAMARFDEEMRRHASGTVWTRGCRNWYTTRSGRLVNNWPLPSWRYVWRTRRLRERDFCIEDC